MNVNEYWELYEDKIMAMIKREFNRQNIKEKEDAISDAYIWFTEAYNKYNPEYNIPFKNYALDYLYRRFKQYYKIQKIRLTCTHKGEIIPYYIVDKDECKPIETKDEYFKEVLKEIIMEYPEPYNKVLYLKYIKDYTQEQTAKILNYSQSKISRLINNVKDSISNTSNPLYINTQNLYKYLEV